MPAIWDNFGGFVDISQFFYKDSTVVVCAYVYRQISNISHTKSQNLNVSPLVLQLSLPNLLKPCVKLRMEM